MTSRRLAIRAVVAGIGFAVAVAAAVAVPLAVHVQESPPVTRFSPVHGHWPTLLDQQVSAEAAPLPVTGHTGDDGRPATVRRRSGAPSGAWKAHRLLAGTFAYVGDVVAIPGTVYAIAQPGRGPDWPGAGSPAWTPGRTPCAGRASSPT